MPTIPHPRPNINALVRWTLVLKSIPIDDRSTAKYEKITMGLRPYKSDNLDETREKKAALKNTGLPIELIVLSSAQTRSSYSTQFFMFSLLL